MKNNSFDKDHSVCAISFLFNIASNMYHVLGHFTGFT